VHNSTKISSSAAQSFTTTMNFLCTSPYTIFQSEEEKGTMGVLKIHRVSVIIDVMQEAIA